MDGLVSFLKLAAEKANVLWGAALLGLVVFASRRLGYIPNLELSWYYAAVGTGLLAGLIIFAGIAAEFRRGLSKAIKNRTQRKRLEEFSLHSFHLADPVQRGILLHYKHLNQRRFMGHYHRALEETVRQGLLERHFLVPNAEARHYQIPAHIWGLLDNPPDGWAERARGIVIDW